MLLPGGRSHVGTARPLIPADGEGPRRSVRIRPFLIAPCAVTNAGFGRFCEATGYRTEAEEIGWSTVFAPMVHGNAQSALPTGGAPDWWRATRGACWRRPEGPGSGIAGRIDHPVCHVSLRDARAYANWAGGRLPREAEWEYAARGRLPDPVYPWGDREPDDHDFVPCNVWQGTFPRLNSIRDGYYGTAPADAFEPNGYGLFNMAGNVWEWTEDAFRVRSVSSRLRRNGQPSGRREHVLKGGSFLCHPSYCHRYRIAARTPAPAETATNHLGFRLAFEVEDRPKP